MSMEDSSEAVSPDRRDFLIKGGVAAGALTIGKVIMDGPQYTGTPDLTGKVVVVTGANTGLGKASAARLARLGAEVCLACRSPEKAEAAAAEIRASTGNAAVSTVPLDLASLASVRACAAELGRRYPRIDVLQNNAGVMALPKRTLTTDGFEYQFGVNHLGHFLLTNLLMGSLLKAERPRIVNLSSAAHQIPPGTVDFEDLMGEKDYQPWKAYGQSKLANILFTKELQRRLDARTDAATAMCCHPGGVRTELGRNLDLPAWAFPLLVPLVYFTKSVEQGAQTQTRLSADPALHRAGAGKYFDNCAEAQPAPPALDAAAARRLWEVSEELTGQRFEI